MAAAADTSPPPPSSPSSPPPPTTTINDSDTITRTIRSDDFVDDPPPPYPSRRRAAAAVRRPPRRQQQPNRVSSSSDIPPSSHLPLSSNSDLVGSYIHPSGSYQDQEHQDQDQDQEPDQEGEEEEGESTETTPFLIHTFTHTRRHRGLSNVSQVSSIPAHVAPSLAQTCLSLFSDTDDDDGGGGGSGGGGGEYFTRSQGAPAFLLREEPSEASVRHHREWGRFRGIGSVNAWRRYFRPILMRGGAGGGGGGGVYYRSLVHLLFINFFYALVAWVYLFVCTIAGTTLLMALPLGAILCFFNLLGARMFARGELALQTYFHSPFSYPAPYPPRPIFYRFRPPTPDEVEAGIAASPSDLVPERSFYRNAYAMFTDPTSYQALFYFIVVKPCITIVLTLLLWVVGVPALVLVLPAPAVLRAVRKIGVWQANVAVEGLYLAVR